MKQTAIYSYFAFGYNYNLLRTGRSGSSLQGDSGSLQSIIGDFFKKLDELDLTVTKNAALDLTVILQEIQKETAKKIVDTDLANRIINACNKLDTTLDSELQLRSAFIVTPKRFDTKNLLEEPGNLLAEGTARALTPITAFDFVSGCRCIAFNLGTAAAFHLMRCLEGALRNYYCLHVKKNRVTPLLWGPMVEHLRKHRRLPPKPLLDHLDNIRQNFRNPTQHPDARYDIDEAQDLLSVTIDALNRMFKDLKNREIIKDPK